MEALDYHVLMDKFTSLAELDGSVVEGFVTFVGFTCQ